MTQQMFAFRKGTKLRWFGPYPAEHEAKEAFQRLYGFWPEEPERVADYPDPDWPQAMTIDYVTIHKGLPVWDYNLERTTVESLDHVDNTGKPWFRTANGGQFDGGRLWYRHPTTGQKAS